MTFLKNLITVTISSCLLNSSQAQNDTARVMKFIELADHFERNNGDSSDYYLEKAKALAEKLKFERGILAYYQQAAITAYTWGHYEKSMQLSQAGLIVARKLGDSLKVFSMLNSIANVYVYLGRYEEQLAIKLNLVKLMEEMKDSTRLSAIYHGLSNAYYTIGQYRKGVDAARHSIYIAKALGKKNDYINRVYSTLAQCYDDLRVYDSALYFYDLAIVESGKNNDLFAKAMIYGYKVNFLSYQNRFDEMLTAANISHVISKETQSRQLIAASLYNLAYAQYLTGSNVEARKNITEAIAIARADSLLEELRNSYEVLAYIAGRDGDFATAASATQKSDSIWNELLNSEVLSKSAELEKKYETEKKEAQIKLQKSKLKQRSTLNYLLGSAAVAAIIVGLLLYRNHHQKQKLQQQQISELEKEKQLTATEAVLKGEEKERTRLAQDLHDGLGGILSGIKYSLNTMKGNLVMTPDNAQAFERSMDMIDTSIKEMRRVAHNMMPEALVKFGLDTALSDFCNDINQSTALKITYQSIGLNNIKLEEITAITIYRIVQELINNILKHAGAKMAIVQVSKTDNKITVTVEDDGKGFNTLILDHARGIGWSNIKNRVEFLKGKLDVNSHEGKGTSVHIEFDK